MAINILSMDGGGPLTVGSLWMLRRIQRECARSGKDFLGGVDVFTGASAGGANSLFMAAAASREEGLEKALAMWSENPLRNDLGRELLAAVGMLSIYDTGCLKRAYETVLRGQTLADLAAQGQYVAIPTFQLKAQPRGRAAAWKVKVFNNFYRDEPDLEALALDVALRTSAAPVFFPVYQGFADGGMYCDNPAMCGLCQVMARPPQGMEDRVEEIRLLSVGIGLEKSFLDAENAPWGWQSWLLDPRRPLALVEAMTEAGSMATDFQCKAILKERYYRLNPPLVSGTEILSYDLEDVYTSGEDHCWQELKGAVNRALELDDPSREPGWLKEALSWLEEVGWCEDARRPASRRAKRRPRRGNTPP